MIMKLTRFPTLIMIALLLCLAMTANVLATPETKGGVVISEVRSSNVRDSTFVVSWITNQETTGFVQYGTDSGNLSQTAHDERGADVNDDTHYVMLTGLAPNTTYFFDVVSGGTIDNNGGAHYQVTTAPTLDIPGNDTIFGQVMLSDGTTPATGTIVYLTLRDHDAMDSDGDAALLSSLITAADDGFWNENLSNARTDDLTSYFTYSASGDQVLIEMQSAADGMATLTVDTAHDSPVSSIPLAVLLASFTATPQSHHMLVTWETVSELNTLGFNLRRGLTVDVPDSLLNSKLIPSGAPGSGQGFAYEWQDAEVTRGVTYYYWLEDVEIDGTTTLHGPVGVTFNPPTSVELASISLSNGRHSRIIVFLAMILLLSVTAYRLSRHLALR